MSSAFSALLFIGARCTVYAVYRATTAAEELAIVKRKVTNFATISAKFEEKYANFRAPLVAEGRRCCI